MVGFKEFLDNHFLIESGRVWKRSNPKEEHGEIAFQTNDKILKTFHPEVQGDLKKLKNFETFKKALINSEVRVLKREDFKNISNTDAFNSWNKNTLDPSKVARVEKQAKSKDPIERPIILQTKSGHQHLIAGNTRSSYHADAGVPVDIIHA